MQYRSFDSLTDSDEEFHPNIDTKSYRNFIKERRKERLGILRSKEVLSEEELNEKRELEYKELPVAQVVEDSFRLSGKQEITEDALAGQLVTAMNNSSVNSFINFLDSTPVALHEMETIIYLNLNNCIKEENKEVGVVLSKLSLLTKWALEFGREYLVSLVSREQLVDNMAQEYYDSAEKAIRDLPDEE